MAVLQCWLCGKTLDLRSDKNGKLYVVCNPCGLQVFVRRKDGMDRLQKLCTSLQKMKIELDGHTELLFSIQGILRQIAGLKSEIENLNEKDDFFFPDEEIIRARNALQGRVDGLLAQLEKEAKH